MSRKLLQTIIVSVVFTGCGKSSDNEESPQLLSTEPLPTGDFEPASLSLVDTNEPCKQLIGFFDKYAENYLPDITPTSSSCQKVSTETFTPEELELIKGEQISCLSDRTCYKIKVTFQKADRVDNYFALVAFFEDGQRAGSLISARSNKQLLPRKGTPVKKGELLSDGLSNLFETFKNWTRK